MDSYDKIGSIRLTERKGPKPNANSHIVITHWDHDNSVSFWIKEKIYERDRKLPKDI